MKNSLSNISNEVLSFGNSSAVDIDKNIDNLTPKNTKNQNRQYGNDFKRFVSNEITYFHSKGLNKQHAQEGYILL